MSGIRRAAPDGPAPFDITRECIGCGLCPAYAPDNVAWNAAGSRCTVARQPRDARELAALLAAAADCPLACLRRGGATVAPSGVEAADGPGEPAGNLGTT